MAISEMAQEYIRSKVENAVGYSFEMFSFENIIEEVAVGFNLSREELLWAKANLDWKVVILDEDPTRV